MREELIKKDEINKDKVNFSMVSDKKLLDKYFDRQMRIPNWDQKVVENKVAFCLGIGGLGN
jgi:hypothetical protein